jgi:hypothetical protein
MKTALIVAAAFALAIATGTMVAQTAGAPPGANPPSSNPPGTMPKTPPSDMPQTPRSNMSPTGSTTRPPDFNTLDTSGVGYVTQQQAAANPWLSKKFTACDSNHDGQLTRSEYAACSNQP